MLLILILITAVTTRHVQNNTVKRSPTDNVRVPNLPPSKDTLHINTPIDNIPVDSIPVLTTKQLQLNNSRLTTQKDDSSHHPLNWTVPFIPLQKALTNLNNKKYQSNLQINSWVSQYYDKIQWDYITSLKNSNIVRCSLLRPFFNGQTCVSCQQHTYFDFDTNQCVVPPRGTVHQPNTHSFVTPVRGYITNLHAANIDLNGRAKQEVEEEYRVKKIKQGLKDCQDGRPFFDGINCINCIQPYPIFNLTSSRCSRCLEKQEYSSQNRGCFDVGEDKERWTLPKALSNIFTGT